MTNVLIIGYGGREHALGWKLAQSEHVDTVFYAPGNAGTEMESKGRNVNIDSTCFESLADLIELQNIDMTIVGPEGPLNDGFVDFLNDRGYNRVFGPTNAAAQLETDKFFSHDILKKCEITQALSTACYSLDEAVQAINNSPREGSVVIKARGLTGGKGVTVCNSKEQALNEIQNHSKKYGPEVLIANRLYGEEFSVFGFSNGEKVIPMKMAFQDHKSLYDKNKGPNTGGMGAYGPVSFANENFVNMIVNQFMTPIVKKMKFDGTEYKGFLYAGMMIANGTPTVLEFNVRMGDPECQTAMMMLDSDLYEIMDKSLEGRLTDEDIKLKSGVSSCVVLSSPGYPNAFDIGKVIDGLDKDFYGVKVFHGGTKREGNQILNSSGRILSVTSYSTLDLTDAKNKAYAAVKKINIEGGFHYRTDIGDK
jgi:phosphoribosylamine---glycine ligase